MSSSTATTRGIRVSVDARFSAEHSAPERQHWFFLYTIRIENTGDLTVQLQSRHWTITDGDGHVEEVQGPGVVGEQPVLMPASPSNTRRAARSPRRSARWTARTRWLGPSGETFDVEIARFELRGPYTVH